MLYDSEISLENLITLLALKVRNEFCSHNSAQGTDIEPCNIGPISDELFN
jgi:hypothetical protein